MKKFLVTLLVALFVVLGLSAGTAQAAGTVKFCTTSNSQAAFLVKATNASGGQVQYYVPAGQCAGWGANYQMGTRPYAFHVPTGWCAEFLQAPYGSHMWVHGSNGGSGGQWVQFVNYTAGGEWWARHYRC